MKRYLGLLIMFCLLLVLVAPVTAQEAPTPEPVGLRPDAPTYALHGPYWVGMNEFGATAASHHVTQVTIWYPALNPDGGAENARYSWSGMPVAGHALRGAPPNIQDGPYPLVIFAHGLKMLRYSAPYLCEHLASQGFVVMAMDYADNWTQTPPFYSTLFTRPQDVSWEIDQAVSLTATGGKLEGLIDTEHIASVGYSLGGGTALASAGAQLEFSSLRRYVDEPTICIAPPELGSINACTETLDHQQELAGLAGLDGIPDKLWPSWGDPRVDAVVGYAPSTVFFGTEGLQGVTVPTMLVVGSRDSLVSPELEVAPAYERLSSTEKALLTFEDADHEIFFWKCSDGPWIIDYGTSWVCSDSVWHMDRAHDLINHFTTAFLLDVLKGDAEAHAALAPDAVGFPGIEYQAQGF